MSITIQTLDNGDLMSVQRSKINSNFTELENAIGSGGGGSYVLEASSSNVIDFNTITTTGTYLIKNVSSGTALNCWTSSSESQDYVISVAKFGDTIIQSQSGRSDFDCAPQCRTYNPTTSTWGAWSNTLAANYIAGLTATVTELNYTDGVTSNIQTQLDNKLNISGGTMTGQLIASTTSIANVGTAQVRNAYAGTTDMEAGVTTLDSGTIYYYYEA